MHSNNDKKSSTYGTDRAPGGGPVIHKGRYHEYSGSNPKIYEPYKRPDTKMQSTSTQGGPSSSHKKQ
ncbi:MAG: hypothetical protein LKM45_00985 [Wolbachia endosymbiont of Alcedoecus sp.]|nr:hypothetical protein [Wolbachia endosymbiont of Alcedoecus sp.]